MANPAFIDKLIKEAKIYVENISVAGGESWEATNAVMQVELDPSYIEPPDAGSVVMANADIMVRSANFVINKAASYSTASANILIENQSFGDYNIAMYVEGSRFPIITNSASIQISPQPVRVYWA
jgi:hypothetical protein